MAGTMVADLFARIGLKADKKEWDKGHELVSGIKEAVGILIGVEAVKGIAEMVGGVVELGGKIHDTAESIGISSESLQELSFGAKLAGIDMESLAGGLKKLSKGLVESARTGKGPVADAFSAMGVSMSTVKDKLKGEGGLDDVLAIVADKFHTMPNGMSKTALAMDLFGRSGAELIPFLNEGADGIAKLRAKANELGVVMSNEAVAGLDDFGDSADELKMTFQGLKQQVVVALLPVLREMLEGFRDWVKTNRDLIASTLTAVVEGLAFAFGILGDVISAAADLIGWFTDGSDEATAVLIGIGVAIASVVVPALLAMAAGWLAALWPLALIAAAVAGFVLLIKNAGKIFGWLWDKIKGIGRAIVNTFKAIGRAIIDTLTAAFDFVSELPVIKQLIWLIKKITGLKSPFETKIASENDSGSKKADDEFKKSNADQAKGKSRATDTGNLGPGTYEIGPNGETVFTPAGGGPSVVVPTPSRPAPAAGAPQASLGPSMIRGGDVHIEINNPTGDGQAIAAVVQEKVDQSMQSWLQQAHEVVG